MANIRPHLVAQGEDLVANASDLLAMCQGVCILYFFFFEEELISDLQHEAKLAGITIGLV